MKRPSSLHIVPQPRKADTRVGLLNDSFKYVNAANTDVRKTFDRIRAELALKAKK